MGQSWILRLVVPLSALLAMAAVAREALAAERPRRASRGGPGAEGHVLDAGGFPIAGARVVARPLDQASGTKPTEIATARSDGEGAFRLRRLGAGSFLIEIEASGYRPARVGVHLPDGSTTLFPVEVRLAPAPAGAGTSSAKNGPEGGVHARHGGAARRSGPGAPVAAASEPEAPAQGRDVAAPLLEARESGARHTRRARPILADADAVGPEDAEALYAAGDALLRAGETAEAVALLERALARDPSYVEAHYRRALGLLGLGRNAEARAEFERVLALRTDGPLAEGARRALDELGAGESGR